MCPRVTLDHNVTVSDIANVLTPKKVIPQYPWIYISKSHSLNVQFDRSIANKLKAQTALSTVTSDDLLPAQLSKLLTQAK